MTVPVPGVRIVEGSGGSHPGSRAGTSVAVFIGRLPEAEGKLEFVSSWSDFQTRFLESGMPSGAAAWLPLAVRGFFANGGSSCHVAAITDAETYVAELDLHLIALEAAEVGMIAVPDLFHDRNDAVADEIRAAVAEHCSALGTRMAILDAPADPAPESAETLATRLKEELLATQTPFTTLYYPWLKVPGLTAGTTQEVPPCGHIAGAWARSDALRGIHKAPANLTLLEVSGLSWDLIDEEHARLHAKGVDCVRLLPGQGLTLWGARTLSDEPEWVQINVRRVVNALTQDIRMATRWVTDQKELNTERLRAIVRNDVTAILTQWWRRGALKGVAAKDAFSVTCDDTNNPGSPVGPATLSIVAQVAPLHPAEFVTIRVSQTRAQN
ncbi:phage tail sheath family protein [Streptomyces sp. NPDC092307]|uniref:phage tail sheath family protein n=1 Tax=Streptomyces sp. NPDC092307 TaxID=3366013 RepID=UPI00380F1B70